MKHRYEAKVDIPELKMVEGEVQYLHEETFKRLKGKLKLAKEPEETKSDANESRK